MARRAGGARVVCCREAEQMGNPMFGRRAVSTATRKRILKGSRRETEMDLENCIEEKIKDQT